MGLIMSPQNSYVAVLTSRNHTVTVHGNRAFKELIMAKKVIQGDPNLI